MEFLLRKAAGVEAGKAIPSEWIELADCIAFARTSHKSVIDKHAKRGMHADAS
jgi:hypothetical protein